MTGPERERERKLRLSLRRSWHMLAVGFVCAFLAAASAMVYANRVARDSERKWCSLIATMDDAYRTTPPQTPAGRKIANDIRRLRNDFHCPPSR
ncbi:hypothetical protein [Micromonospora sp. NPDC048063]|uniref:hypothetical protein n=1 Tax=Micromonospora sp. NPDC048063 TaxID=3364256 RepID=UPI00371A7E32